MSEAGLRHVDRLASIDRVSRPTDGRDATIGEFDDAK